MAKPRKLPACRALAVGHDHACLIRFGRRLIMLANEAAPPGDTELGCKADAVDQPWIT